MKDFFWFLFIYLFIFLRNPENTTSRGNQNSEHAGAFWPVRVWAGVTCEVTDAEACGPQPVSVFSTLAYMRVDVEVRGSGGAPSVWSPFYIFWYI